MLFGLKLSLFCFLIVNLRKYFYYVFFFFKKNRYIRSIELLLLCMKSICNIHRVVLLFFFYSINIHTSTLVERSVKMLFFFYVYRLLLLSSELPQDFYIFFFFLRCGEREREFFLRSTSTKRKGNICATRFIVIKFLFSSHVLFCLVERKKEKRQ